jgi:hypothetical protein
MSEDRVLLVLKRRRWSVGQKVVVAMSRGHQKITLHESEITKIGRKWVTLKGYHGRFDMETGWIDGGDYLSPGRVWTSKEEYEAEVAADAAWKELRDLFGRCGSRPSHMSEPEIRTMLAALSDPPKTVGGGSSRDHAPAASDGQGNPALATPYAERRGAVRWPKPGDRMVFMNRNGYEGERADAARTFEPGQVLTVARCEVGSFSHSLWFAEDDRRGWNGVMFELEGEPERYPLPADGVGRAPRPPVVDGDSSRDEQSPPPRTGEG